MGESLLTSGWWLMGCRGRRLSVASSRWRDVIQCFSSLQPPPTRATPPYPRHGRVVLPLLDHLLVPEPLLVQAARGFHRRPPGAVVVPLPSALFLLPLACVPPSSALAARGLLPPSGKLSATEKAWLGGGTHQSTSCSSYPLGPCNSPQRTDGRADARPVALTPYASTF